MTLVLNTITLFSKHILDSGGGLLKFLKKKNKYKIYLFIYQEKKVRLKPARLDTLNKIYSSECTTFRHLIESFSCACKIISLTRLSACCPPHGMTWKRLQNVVHSNENTNLGGSKRNFSFDKHSTFKSSFRFESEKYNQNGRFFDDTL